MVERFYVLYPPLLTMTIPPALQLMPYFPGGSMASVDGIKCDAISTVG